MPSAKSWLFCSGLNVSIIKEIVSYEVVSEWVIKFNGLSGDSGHRGPYSPYKPYNHSLYIGIIIFPHIDNTQSTDHNELKKKELKKEQQKS